MAQTYFIILTLLGKAKVAEAIANGTDIGLSQVAVGDGDYTPSEGQTALVSEKYRAGANQVYRDEPENPNWIVVELVIPAETGGWNVREVGIFDAAGDLFAIGKYAPTYKPTFDEGSGKELVIRAILEISSQANVTVTVDPSVVLATREYVDDQIDGDVAAHAALDAAHPASKIVYDPAVSGLTATRVQGAVDELHGRLLPLGFIVGLVPSNSPSDQAHDVVISAGACRDSANSVNIFLAAALTKRIDAVWAPGNNAGGLFTGVVGSGTTYHLFMIRNAEGVVDAGWDVSATASNRPAEYTAYRRIFSIKTNASADIPRLKSTELAGGGVHIQWSSPPLDIDVAEDATANLRTLSSIPSGLKFRVGLNCLIQSAGGPYVYISDPDADDELPSNATAPLGTIGFSSTDILISFVEVWTNTSSQIRTRSQVASTTLRISNQWFEDMRR